jgi:hypothetical protein
MLTLFDSRSVFETIAALCAPPRALQTLQHLSHLMFSRGACAHQCGGRATHPLRALGGATWRRQCHA